MAGYQSPTESADRAHYLQYDCAAAHDRLADQCLPVDLLSRLSDYLGEMRRLCGV